MASSKELTLSMARFTELRRAVPGFERGDFISVITALIWLDQQAGRDSDANMIVISEELSLWLPFWTVITSPEVNALLNAPGYTDDQELDATRQDRLHDLLMRPIEVVFIDPRGQYVYPVINGLRRIVAVDQRLGRGPHAYTATLLGEPIQVDY